jgi:hypothetical protein
LKEFKLGNIQFTDTAIQAKSDPYIIGSFGAEGTGKSRFPLTGPEVIGYIPLERKTYKTVMKDAEELGKRMILPKDHEAFVVNLRKANILSSEAASKEKNPAKASEVSNEVLKTYYRDYLNRIYDAVYAMLAHDDIRLVVIDTFTQMCNIAYSALYGDEDKVIRIGTKIYKDRRDYRQEMIDFLNSLSSYHKHIILTHREKDEYNEAGQTGRKIWEGFPFLGNYTNLLIHHESNKKWNPSSEDTEKQWHYAMTVRTCQLNPVLESGEYKRFWKDEEITFQNLITAVDPDVDMDSIT